MPEPVRSYFGPRNSRPFFLLLLLAKILRDSRISGVLRSENEMGFIPQQRKGNMKTTIALLIALGSMVTVTNALAGDKASCCNDTTVALSPRATANQTVVVSGKEDTALTRADLGTGARAKATGAHTANLAAGSARDVDLLRGRELGAAAKAKATGNTGSATIEMAPLK
jgi:hypothetical protein